MEMYNCIVNIFISGTDYFKVQFSLSLNQSMKFYDSGGELGFGSKIYSVLKAL